jgi:hypothetical protein
MGANEVLARIQQKDNPGQWGELLRQSICSKSYYFTFITKGE